MPADLTRVALSPLASSLPLGFPAPAPSCSPPWNSTGYRPPRAGSSWAFVMPLELLAGILAAAPGARSVALGVFLLILAVNMLALATGALQAKPTFGGPGSEAEPLPRR